VAHVGGLCEPVRVEGDGSPRRRDFRGNLRVPRTEFTAVSALAERRCSELERTHASDWYLIGSP
jgi:hypothetical protein